MKKSILIIVSVLFCTSIMAQSYTLNAADYFELNSKGDTLSNIFPVSVTFNRQTITTTSGRQECIKIIENTRRCVASVVSNETTQLYWNVGNTVNTIVLQGSRAEYGKQIVVSVSRQLVAEYGDSFEEKNLRRRNI